VSTAMNDRHGCTSSVEQNFVQSSLSAPSTPPPPLPPRRHDTGSTAISTRTSGSVLSQHLRLDSLVQHNGDEAALEYSSYFDLHTSTPIGGDDEASPRRRRPNDVNSQASSDSCPNDGSSSVVGAVLNFTNTIIGAGAIGLGGAIARSGGLISIVSICAVALLTKLSLDLVVELSLYVVSSRQRDRDPEDGGGGRDDILLLQNSSINIGSDASVEMIDDISANNGSNAATSMSYEDLGSEAFGYTGRFAVMISKFMYAGGCLIAYIVVIRDNFGAAMRSLLYTGQDGTSAFWDQPLMVHDNVAVMVFPTSSAFLHWIIHQDMLLTWILSAVIIFPLCLLRNMTPLSKLSCISVVAMIGIVFIVIYLYVDNPNNSIRHPADRSIYHDWIEVHPGGYIQWYVFVHLIVP
jgi:Transmembrane amino acid transporter protein